MMRCVLVAANGDFLKCSDVSGPYTRVRVSEASIINVESVEDLRPFLSEHDGHVPDVIEYVVRPRRTVTLHNVGVDTLVYLIRDYWVLRFRCANRVFWREGSDWVSGLQTPRTCKCCGRAFNYAFMSLTDLICKPCTREVSLEEPQHEVVYDRAHALVKDERPGREGLYRQLTREEEAEHVVATAEEVYGLHCGWFDVEMERTYYAI